MGGLLRKVGRHRKYMVCLFRFSLEIFRRFGFLPRTWIFLLLFLECLSCYGLVMGLFKILVWRVLWRIYIFINAKMIWFCMVELGGSYYGAREISALRMLHSCLRDEYWDQSNNYMIEEFVHGKFKKYDKKIETACSNIKRAFDNGKSIDSINVSVHINDALKCLCDIDEKMIENRNPKEETA